MNNNPSVHQPASASLLVYIPYVLSFAVIWFIYLVGAFRAVYMLYSFAGLYIQKAESRSFYPD